MISDTHIGSKRLAMGACEGDPGLLLFDDALIAGMHPVGDKSLVTCFLCCYFATELTYYPLINS